MTYKKTIPLIAAFLIFFYSSDASDLQQALFGVDWTGTAELRRGDFTNALKNILIERPTGDSLFRDFKLAVIYRNLRNYSTALSLLRSIADRQPALSPAVYIYIAEIEKELGRTSNSLASYRAVLRNEIPQRLRHYIYEQLRNIIEADTSITIEQAPWLEEYYRWLAPIKEAEAPTIIDTIENLIKNAEWKRMDSLLRIRGPEGKAACRIAKSIRTAYKEDAPGVFSLYWGAKTAHLCGELTIAKQFLEMVEKRKNFADSIPLKQYRLFKAKLYYDTQEWNRAIESYKQYLNNYGQDAEALRAIARAYRKLNKKKVSDEWYNRIISGFPRSPISQDILWQRAWELEEEGRFDLASEQYRLIIKKYTQGNRTDESYLRLGLCYYKMKKFDAARAILDTFVNKLPESPHSPAGFFWLAKCYLAENDISEAAPILRLISRKDPFNYYAHRSRRLLEEMGEKVEILIDTNYSGAALIGWLDSAYQSSSAKKALSPADSNLFVNGLYMASIGDIEKAHLILEPLELGCSDCLSLLYKLAMLYLFTGATSDAFRIAKRLTLQIPSSLRAEMPLEAYRLFYPPFYTDLIIPEAKRHNLDPYLISGIIRQESIFNPEIVSPAGAIGLMQIMPYTGKYIAEKKGRDFSVDSLYLPHYNIHFGTYYLNELREQFDTNLVMILAAYNAGPHNAKKWMEKNKNEEFDLSVENIGFTETRNYVKKVLANYWTYRFLSQNTSYSYSYYTDYMEITDQKD